MEKSLRQFLMVAELKSLSQAANRLFISQPTLTHNMKKLEEALGVTLFVRSARGMGLTSYGELLLDQAKIMQRVHENMLSKIELMRTKKERGLNIGVGHAWWQLFFRDLLRDYRIHYPNAPVNIDLGNHLRAMDQLLCGDIDLFIGHQITGLSSRAGAAFLPLFKVRDYCFVRQGHPLLGQASTLEHLIQYPHLDVDPDETRYRRQVVENTRQKDSEHRNFYHLAERVVWATSSLSAAIDIMLDSDAIMTYTASIADYLSKFGVQPLIIEEMNRPFTVGLYTLSDRCEDDYIVQLAALILSYLPALKDKVSLMPGIVDGKFPAWCLSET